VDGEQVALIGPGLLILLGVAPDDGEATAQKLAKKTSELRIFEDEAGKMNRSIVEAGGESLVVSQFTLYADCRKGRRPSFTNVAKPDHADLLYQGFCKYLAEFGVPTCQGRFGKRMLVSLENDGPVTIVLDTLLF